MASDFSLVDIRGWEYDLHSVRLASVHRFVPGNLIGFLQVYTAYMGYFQNNGIPWSVRSCSKAFRTPTRHLLLRSPHRYERSWGHLFNSFEDFLAFSWPVITVTDASTGRAHIVTRMTSIGAFLKMIKTRCVNTVAMIATP